MSEDVMRQHIQLYVNEYSSDLGTTGKHAVLHFLNVGTDGRWKPEDVFLPE
jgi:predicted solute-binding protein